MTRSLRELGLIHKHSIRHRHAVEAADRCGCFYCLSLFHPSEILDWVDEDEDTGVEQTALCPRCGIDAVLPNSSGFAVDFDLLVEMERRFFGLLGASDVAKARSEVRSTDPQGDRTWRPRDGLAPAAIHHGLEGPHSDSVTSLLQMAASATLFTTSRDSVIVGQLQPIGGGRWTGVVLQANGPSAPHIGARVEFAEQHVHSATLTVDT